MLSWQWRLRSQHRSSLTSAATLFTAAAISSVLAGPASATLINYNPAPTTDTGWNACGTGKVAALAGHDCRTTAFFEKNSLNKEFKNNPGGVSVIFGAAFNAWNNNNNSTLNPAATTAQGWTLTNGGDPGGTLNVTTAKAIQLNGVTQGGASIFITPNAALLATLNAAVTAANAAAAVGKKDYKITWAQGAYDNFQLPPNVGTGPAFYEMDVKTFTANTAGNDPSYCAGFSCPGGTSFDDDPNLRYLAEGTPQAFFFGNTYISIYSVANKTLTVYDGVDYGWHNHVKASAPEPSSWALMLLGVGGLGAAARARARAAVRA
jgi:hypothetical protein